MYIWVYIPNDEADLVRNDGEFLYVLQPYGCSDCDGPVIATDDVDVALSYRTNRLSHAHGITGVQTFKPDGGILKQHDDC